MNTMVYRCPFCNGNVEVPSERAGQKMDFYWLLAIGGLSTAAWWWSASRPT